MRKCATSRMLVPAPPGGVGAVGIKVGFIPGEENFHFISKYCMYMGVNATYPSRVRKGLNPLK
jgi:hypothetical protein